MQINKLCMYVCMYVCIGMLNERWVAHMNWGLHIWQA
jgi:hypothetical protein